MIPSDLVQKLFEEEKERTRKAILKKIASFTKAIKNAHLQLEQSKEFEQVQHLAELVKANFPLLKRGMTEITVSDWNEDNTEHTIILDPKKSPKELLEAMFRKSQKLKRALSPLESHLSKLSHQIEHWQTALQQVESLTSIESLKKLNESLKLFPKKEVKTIAKALPYHVFHSVSGIAIYVGKNASSNDVLTFQIANGNDLWLHAHGLSGSHVVVRKGRDKAVDSETLQDALQLALYYSKARSLPEGSYEVLISERKYVARLPRMPKGKVVVSKHKIHTATLDKNHIEAIKSRTKQL